MTADHTEIMTLIEEETVTIFADRLLDLPAVDAGHTETSFTGFRAEIFSLVFAELFNLLPTIKLRKNALLQQLRVLKLYCVKKHIITTG